MFKNLDFLFCCGNSNTAKLQKEYTASLYSNNNDDEISKNNNNNSNNMMTHGSQRREQTGTVLQIEKPVPTPMKISHNKEQRDENLMQSIIMGKSPSDVDLIGLSKSILMRSCDRKSDSHSKRRNLGKEFDEDPDGQEISSNTPYNQIN